MGPRSSMGHFSWHQNETKSVFFKREKEREREIMQVIIIFPCWIVALLLLLELCDHAVDVDTLHRPFFLVLRGHNTRVVLHSAGTTPHSKFVFM